MHAVYIVVVIALVAVLAAANGPIDFTANFDLTAPNMKNGGGFLGTTKYSWKFGAWSVQLAKQPWNALYTYSDGAKACTQDCQKKRFCTYNLDLNIGDTFNIADWIYNENDPGKDVDFNACNMKIYYETATDPADWHLAEFNAKPPTAVTTTAADSTSAGNQGTGNFRIFMKDDCGTDDHMTIRVSPTPITSDVDGAGAAGQGCAAHRGMFAYEFGSCGCQRSIIQTPMPQFFYEPTFGTYSPTDRTDTINGVQCKHYSKAPTSSSVVTDLWVSAADDTTPCSATFADGRNYVFSGVQLNPPFTEADFQAPASCSCSGMMDTAIVLERSNTVTTQAFDAQKTFAQNLVNTFSISGSTSQFSVGTYGSGFQSISRLYSGTSSNGVTATVKSLKCCPNMTVPDQCCDTPSNVVSAINGGLNQLTATGQRSTAGKNIVIVTNGITQTDAEIQAAIDAAKARLPGVNVFVVAGDKVVYSSAVTTADGKDTHVVSVTWPSFPGDAVNQVSAAICATTLKDCGAGCCGLCDCGNCLAPDHCDSTGCQTAKSNGICCVNDTPFCAVPDKCTKFTCNNDQCDFSAVPCLADNACFTYACDKTTGVCQPTAVSAPGQDDACMKWSCDTRQFQWVQKPVPCTGKDPCLDYLCDPVEGCKAVKKNPLPTECVAIAACQCTPSDKCFNGACVSGDCVFTAINCDDNDACTTDSCADGACVHVPINCDDGSPCTIDACTAGSCVHTANLCDDGNLCTTDTCDVNSGCHSALIECDDSSVCTNDACDTKTGKCAFTPISCDDNLACTNDTCHPFKGCISESITCPSSGECFQDFCSPDDKDPTKYVCTARNVSGCVPAEVKTIAIGASIGGAAIAGIIIAIVVCVGAAGGASYAMYQRMGDSGLRSVSNNPIYREDGNKGANPLYRSSTQ